MIFLWALRLLLSAQLILIVQCIVNGYNVEVELLQDRSQAWVDAPYGWYADHTDNRGCGGVLIHPSFVLTSGNTMGRKLEVKGFRVRVASTWSFQYGHMRRVDRYYQLQLEPERDWERFRVILVHLMTPFISESSFCHLAFIPPLHYHWTSLNRDETNFTWYHTAGYGAESKNWLSHKLQWVGARMVYLRYCARESFYAINEHGDMEESEQILHCYTDQDCELYTCPFEYMGLAKYYDDGSGVFVKNTNRLMTLLTTRLSERRPWTLLMGINVPRFQDNIVRHIRSLNKNFYRQASEQEFEYLRRFD